MIPEGWKEYLDGWRALTDAESQAISVQDWEGLTQTQQAKRELQKEFEVMLDEAVNRSKARDSKSDAIPQAVRDVVQGLMASERANAAAIAVALDRVRSRLDRADHTRRNLKQVQRAYSASLGDASHHWQYYS